jgi:hypothetical protein
MTESHSHGHDESVLRSDIWRTAESSAAYLLDHLKPGLDLVDVGCGPGTITVELARALGARARRGHRSVGGCAARAAAHAGRDDATQ